MSNPLVHAERSARKWGGAPDDYLAVHRWFDSTKGSLFDNRHRIVLHNAFGILLCEQVFGAALTNSAGRRVFLRDIGLQHVLEDLGCVPTLAECLAELPLRPWMGGARLVRPQPDETEFEAGPATALDESGAMTRANAIPATSVARQAVEHHPFQQEPCDAGPV